jgi:hypothetical protein
VFEWLGRFLSTVDGRPIGVVVGLTAWLTLVGSAQRYSYGADQDMGSSAYYWVLPVAAVVLGFVLPKEAAIVGAMLGLPGLALSPWTAPRGDNDGLWLLIVPFLAIFTLILVGVASFGAWLRDKTTSAAG